MATSSRAPVPQQPTRFPWCLESPRLCGHSIGDSAEWWQPCPYTESYASVHEASLPESSHSRGPATASGLAVPAADTHLRVPLPAVRQTERTRSPSSWGDRPVRGRAASAALIDRTRNRAASALPVGTDLEAPDADAAAGGPSHASTAATLIQARWRERLGLVRVQVREGIHEAAQTIQSLWRFRKQRSLRSESGRKHSSDLRSTRAAATKNDLSEPLLASNRDVVTPPLSNSGAPKVVSEESLLMKKGKGLEKWLEEKKQQAMTHMIKAGVPQIEKWIADLGELIKANATYDPDMWPWVKVWLRNAIGAVWDDLSNEIKLNVNMTLDDKLCRASTKMGLSLSRYEQTKCLIPYLRFRAFILWHYIPFDKTFFGKIKDPIYLVLFVITLIPMPGVRVVFFGVILIMLLFPGPPDDFQLTNFILIFKGTQFFTTGVCGMFMGGMHYYICYMFHMDTLLDCIDANGPGNSDPIVLGLCDYFGSIVLVWVAFLLLPFSDKHAFPGERQVKKVKKETICCGIEGVKNRGHRLGKLLRWDVGSFLLTVAGFTLLYCLRPGHRESNDIKHETLDLKSTIFWLRTTYSLMSLPFAIFMIPVIRNMLTNSVNSGFDKHGVCQIYELPLTEEYLASQRKR